MKRSRGQAVVELALGSLLLITIMLFAVHFGEAAMMILKVQEAGNYALWDAAGRRVHDYDNGGASYAPFGSLPARTQKATTARYKDFLGTGTPKTGRKESRAEGRNLAANCRADDTLTFNVVDPGALRHGAVFSDMTRYDQPDTGGVSCQVNADVAALHIADFLEDGAGFFKEKQVKRPVMGVCATRWCSGRLDVLLGTWALDGPVGQRNNAESPLYDASTNSTYHAMVKQLFDDNGKGESGAVKRFAETMSAERIPYDEDTFFMSYRGIESDYAQRFNSLTGHMHPVPGAQWRDYDTNGAPYDLATPNAAAWNTPGVVARRSAKFLGLPVLRP